MSHEIEKIFDKSNATFVSFVAKTKPKMKKKGNPFTDKNVEKVAKVRGIVNFRYQNSVNNQRVRENKEDNFESAPRRWGQRIPKTPFVEHKGNKYLEVKREHVDYTFYIDGKEIGEDQAKILEQYLYASEPKRQEVDNTVTLRDYKLESIEELNANNQTYTKGGEK